VSRSALFKCAALATCLLGLAACKATPVAAPIAPPTVQTATGPTDEPIQTLPKDLYPQMPVYPGAKIDHVRKPKGAMREIMFSSDAQMPQMVAFYKDALKKNDFHITRR